jgi:hypothetical protein
METGLNLEKCESNTPSKKFSAITFPKPEKRMSGFNLAGRKSLEGEEKVFESDSSSSD